VSAGLHNNAAGHPKNQKTWIVA